MLNKARQQVVLLASIFFILFNFSSTVVKAQSGCELSMLGQFLEEAQTLGADTERLGRQLLSCPKDSYQSTAIYWLSFFYARNLKDKELRQLGQSLANLSRGSEKDRLLYSAWQGEFSELSQRVRNGQISYADDPTVLLTLARNYVRFQKYREGLEIYQQLISLEEENDALEIERLYAYIWSGDQQAALLRIAALKRYQLSNYLKAGVARAEQVLGTQVNSESIESANMGEAWLSIASKDWVNLRGYRRRSLEVSYEGLFQAQANLYELSHPLDPERQNEASLLVAYPWRISETYDFLAEFGFFSAGEQNIYGGLSSLAQFSENFAVGFGVKREPATLIGRTYLKPDLGIMRDSGYFDLSLMNRIYFKASLARDGAEAIFNQYQGELNLGNSSLERQNLTMSFFAPFELMLRPKASVYQRSYPREIKLGLGLRARMTAFPLWDILAEARMLSVNRSYLYAPASYDKLVGGMVRLEARYYVQKSWFVFAEAQRELVERNPDEPVEEQESLVLIGAALVGPAASKATEQD